MKSRRRTTRHVRPRAYWSETGMRLTRTSGCATLLSTRERRFSASPSTARTATTTSTIRSRSATISGSARSPGLKPFIREAETKQREQTLIAANDSRAAAEKALTEARARVLAAEATNTLVARAKAVADLFAAEVTLRNRSNQLAVAKAEL